jgi:hypothetical protein
MEGESALKKQKITEAPPIMALSFWFHLIFPHLSLRDWVAMKRLNRVFANYEKLNDLIKNTEEECFGDIPKKHWDRLDETKCEYGNEWTIFITHPGKFLLLFTSYQKDYKNKYQYYLQVCISKEELIKKVEKIFFEKSALMVQRASYHTFCCVVVRADVPYITNTNSNSSFKVWDFYLSKIVKLEELNLKSR